MKRRSGRPVWLPPLLALAVSAGAARAELGRGAASVEADRARFAARAEVTSKADYTVHSLTAANGSVVREYLNASGVVFAVAWRGPSRPDLRQLLGDQFAVMQADNVRTGGPRRRAPLRVDRADFVLRTGGHAGAMWGLAVIPGAAPANFVPDPLP